MPPIKIPEQAKEASSGCILRLGKSNNVFTWNEELKSTVGALYGSTANFLQTNTRYVQPLPVEADYLPPVEEGGAAITVALTNVDAPLPRRIWMNRKYGQSCGERCPQRHNQRSRNPRATRRRY